MMKSLPEPSREAIPDPLAILFDLDGTIVDTVGTRVEAWLRTFREAGIPADPSHVAALVGCDGKRLAVEVATRAGHSLDGDQAELIDRRSGELFTELNVTPRPLPGIVELLTALRASGLLWSIATSSRPEQVQASLDSLALPARPPVTDGSSVRHAKPAPDLLLLAAEQLGVRAPACWYVGDATWDMLAARAAGMLEIGVTTGAADEDALRRAGAVAVSPTVAGLQLELRERRLLPG